MASRPRIDPVQGRAAIREYRSMTAPDRQTVATAVRWVLQELSRTAPGGATEVRVPPYGVVQCLDGPRHTRGTPPNVVQTDGATLIELALGMVTWQDAVASGKVLAGGARADLSHILPLPGVVEDPAGR